MTESPEGITQSPSGTDFDPLSQVLQTVRLTGSLFFLWEVSSPFATPAPAGQQLAPVLLPHAQQIISYHVVVEGRCWGGLLGKTPLRLEAGDVLLVPRGAAYVIGDSEHRCRAATLHLQPTLDWFRTMAAGELPFVVEDGGGGPERARLVCGFLGCDLRPFNPVLGALPSVLRLRPGGGDRSARLRGLIDYVVAEARNPGPGSRGILVRLGELMFMEVVRRCLHEGPELPAGWLAGMRDPVVGRCLSLMHQRPAEGWTLARLATSVGASRSGLAQRFTTCVGEAPIQYLTRWRVALASQLLDDDSLSVGAIAERVGYGSGPAFSRAFSRIAGCSPSDWRRRA